jgi:hypothetical protein
MARFWPAPGGGGGGASVTVSDTAPAEPAQGDLWFDSTDSTMYLWYFDGVSGQWVQISTGPVPEPEPIVFPDELDAFLLPGM